MLFVDAVSEHKICVIRILFVHLKKVWPPMQPALILFISTNITLSLYFFAHLRNERDTNAFPSCNGDSRNTRRLFQQTV